VAGRRDRAWAGIDVGKRHHWVCVVDAEGQVLVSAKLVNDETEIRALLARMIGLADQLTWAVDIIGAPSALLLTMLRHADQSVRYASGRLVSAMSAAYTGEGKTDARDAYVIAETAPQSWTGVNERHAIALDNSDVSPVRSASRRIATLPA